MPHPCVLEVDLQAINANLRAVRDLVGDRTILAAVKADAYGHGIVEVARSIETEGTADWLGIATVSEGVVLRRAGVTLPALKFSTTLPEELDEALVADVTLTVADPDGVAAAGTAAARRGVVAPVHLKVDTGMGRIGVSPDHAVDLAGLVADHPHLSLDGIFTHLAVSDVPEGQDFTAAQLDAFRATVARVVDAVGPVPHVHAANSAAVLAHDLTGTNLVRPGIMVYGSYPDPLTPRTRPLHPTVRWTTRVTFLKRVAVGESVGYGRRWVAERDTWVATVAVGYGDGYSRLLSNRGRMLVDGVPRPVVGRVCMDQVMVDLGPDEPAVGVGSEVVLIGRQGDAEITVEELADLMGTIPYEVTCLITQRVERRWVNGPSV